MKGILRLARVAAQAGRPVGHDRLRCRVFSAYKLPTPRSVTRMESPLGLGGLLSRTDSLMLLPRQWTDSPLFKAVLQPIALREKLMAPDILLIAR